MKFLWFRCDEIIAGTTVGIGVLSILLGGFFFMLEMEVNPDMEKCCRISAEADSLRERLRGEGKAAVVLGYTGETGKALVQELAKAKVFKKVVLIGRREVSLPGNIGPEFEQVLVDFEKLDDSAAAFEGADVAFCCLGTTRSKAGSEGFVRVDHDYVLKAAEIAKSKSCKHFNLVSSQGANKNSSFLYPRTKAQVEDALKVIHFDRLSIFRPGVLLCDREEHRGSETFLRLVLKPVSYVFPTAITTPTEVVARAMINNAAAPKEAPVELYENKAIHMLADTARCK